MRLTLKLSKKRLKSAYILEELFESLLLVCKLLAVALDVCSLQAGLVEASSLFRDVADIDSKALVDLLENEGLIGQIPLGEFVVDGRNLIRISDFHFQYTHNVVNFLIKLKIFARNIFGVYADNIMRIPINGGEGI